MLGQLGNRVQHALRAFTPDDAKALRATVRTFPKSDFYDLEELLTQMGTGEAAVTILSESGVPTPVVHTRMRPPHARMGPADDVDGAAKSSPLYREVRNPARQPERPRDARSAPRAGRASNLPARHLRASARRKRPKPRAEAPTRSETSSKSSTGRTIQRELVRGLFGLLKKRV